LQVGIREAGEIERLDAVHVRHHLGQVSHVNQRAADIAITEVLDLGPVGVLPAMGTKSREVIWGGQIMGAKMRARHAREAAQKAAREAAVSGAVPISVT
jgi:hypothetical protein